MDAYCSLMKEHQHATFDPVSCLRPKFTQNEHPPWSEVCVDNGVYLWSVSTAQVLCISGARKCIILHQRLLQGSFALTNVANVVSNCKLHHAHSNMVLFRVLLRHHIVSKLCGANVKLHF